MHIACGRGQLRCVELLLKKGHADLSALDEDGLTPALYAARSGFVAVMHMLVENGSNLQDKDPNGRSLLHYAAGNGRAAMVRYLTRSGMDINCVDSKGNTPLHLIAQANSVDSIKLGNCVSCSLLFVQKILFSSSASSRWLKCEEF